MAVEFLGKVDNPPAKASGDRWARYFKETFEPNPGETYRFGGTSSSTASNLRKRFGLDAFTQKEDDGEVYMYVTYKPADVERIQREFAENSAKRKAKRASGGGNGAKSTSGSTPATAKATAKT